jgi:hypothetical protein
MLGGAIVSVFECGLFDSPRDFLRTGRLYQTPLTEVKGFVASLQPSAGTCKIILASIILQRLHRGIIPRYSHAKANQQYKSKVNFS